MNYEEFVNQKRITSRDSGFSVPRSALNPMLFPFQKDIVIWALRRGKAAVFADVGLGKTAMQLDWARNVAAYTGRPVLILAPLAVAHQTAREGNKFGIPVRVCERATDIGAGVNITNYEKLHHFDPEPFGGIVLDESSILKAYDGTTRLAITHFGSHIPYRMACTATPAPNDLTELCNHAEFLGIMRQNEIKALFFTQDGNSTSSWRLKGHASENFYIWMASWAVALRRPSDLGHSDEGFILPPLHIEQIVIDNGWKPKGYLLPAKAVGLNEQRAARRESLDDRVAAAADLVNNSDEPWVVWCDLNAESAALAVAIPDAVEIRGSDTPEHKAQSMLGFSTGAIRVLVTKPSIAGFGMNWQHCNKAAYVGISHSYEQLYQSLGRLHRFGQKRQVTAYLITSKAEGNVYENIQRKQRQAEEMMDQLITAMDGLSLGAASREDMEYREDVATGDGWTFYLGDSVRRIDELADDSVGLTVFSPPFPGMYVYTNSPHDMGNVQSVEEMIEQFRYLAGPEKLLRVTMPGRHALVHLTQGVAQKGRDGYIGLKDFRGAVIQMMEEEGWIYYGEICIQKNPQVKAVRTKDRGLMFKTLASDAAHMHVALADYVIQFRKPGDNPEPIRAGKVARYNNDDGWVSTEEWIKWAHPIWTDIRETNVLNVRQARETDDERHLCPLQLDVIERCIKLWSNPGDIVFSPFGGIGSEGYMAIKLGRRAVLVELKESYWRSGVEHLRLAELESQQGDLFSFAGITLE